jgi:hypothetical protein
MNNIVLLRDSSGINPVELCHFDIISLNKKGNIKKGFFGEKFDKFLPFQKECFLEKISEEKDIAFSVPYFVEFNERGFIKDIFLETKEHKIDYLNFKIQRKPSFYDLGFGGKIVFTKKQLKETFGFKRISKKRISKKRFKRIMDFLYTKIYEYSCFLTNDIYSILLENDNGEVINSMDFISSKYENIDFLKNLAIKEWHIINNEDQYKLDNQI